MRVVGHDRVCEYTETSGYAGLIKCIADDLFEFVGLEDRQPIVGNRGEEVCGCIAGDLEHT